MKKVVLLIIVVAIIVLIIPKSNKKNEGYNTIASSSEVSSGNLKLIMSKEPSAKDYVLTDVGVLYISVIDDGTRRDGLASYFCQLMKDENIKASRVKIVRFGSQNDPNRDNSYGVLLGESWCN